MNATFHQFGRLSNVNSADYDAHINYSHCLECLKMLLSSMEGEGELNYSPLFDEMASSYLTLNLGDETALKWALELDPRAR